MRRLTFDAWEDGHGNDPSPTAWIMLWDAFIDPAVDPMTRQPIIQLGRDAARTVAAIQVEEAFRSLQESLSDGKIRLKPAGGEMLLEESAFELMKQLWDAKKAQFPPAVARFRQITDDWLASNVTHVKPEEVTVAPKAEGPEA
jgi:hypothetical protein